MTREEVVRRTKLLVNALENEAQNLKDRLDEMQEEDTSTDAADLIQDMLEGDLDDWSDIYGHLWASEKNTPKG